MYTHILINTPHTHNKIKEHLIREGKDPQRERIAAQSWEACALGPAPVTDYV